MFIVRAHVHMGCTMGRFSDLVADVCCYQGGEIASTFDNPGDVVLGECKLIEEVMIGEDKMIHFSGCKMGEACTIVLRGASTHLLDEAERSLHDALCVLQQTVQDTRVIPGGGCPEMVMAKVSATRISKAPRFCACSTCSEVL